MDLPSARCPLMRRLLAAAVACALTLVALGHAADAPDNGPSVPEPPRVLMETDSAPITGKTIVVKAGGDLQSALDSARPGDVITLPPKAAFRGPFTLPK